MKKLSNEDLMDYVDGTLDAARLTLVEEHLKASPEEAQLVADMKLALSALHEWDAAEPVRVSDNFWPELRDRLPEKPHRSWWRGAAAQMGEWLWPAHSPLRVSARVAFVAMVMAVAAWFFAPQQAQRPIVAEEPPLTTADMAFIQQSLRSHKAYDMVQPLNGSLPLAIADGRDGDGDGEDTDDEPYTP
jgi:anti-sigma factor RsiW